ncbi:carbonic anhydrase 7 isoform X1 [Hyla sarda]|uniref:carbonic anhydrase 7 isoform X1 n=1 Tax=Hyla sarda TaxID=327740 RepID=UPI0024C46C3B|nr:carbonic anhydrase 7 isoform X1 [Hyla sarda]
MLFSQQMNLYYLLVKKQKVKNVKCAAPGPSEWYRYFPIAQGNRQSPINIVTSQAVFNPSLPPLVVSYDQCTSINISNNGHSVMVEFDDNDDKTVISGGPLNDPYRLKQFHFHWGNQDNEGSEHTVDGKSYPCELHLVHWNAKSYSTFSEAAAASDGLVVIGVFMEIEEKHPGLDRLTDALYMVRFKGTKAQFNNFNPKCLLPSSLEYWTYPGSLTTPPLNESVNWIVLKEPIKVSEKQMERFRKTILFNDEEEEERIHMVNNFRPPQPLNGRKVQASFKC